MLCLGNLMLWITTWKKFTQDYEDRSTNTIHEYKKIKIKNGSGDSYRFLTHFILCGMMKSNFQIFKTLQFRQGDVQNFIVQYIRGLQKEKTKNNLHLQYIWVKEHCKNSIHVQTPDCNGLAYLINALLPDI